MDRPGVVVETGPAVWSSPLLPPFPEIRIMSLSSPDPHEDSGPAPEPGADDAAIERKLGDHSRTLELEQLNRRGVRSIRAITMRNLRSFIEGEVNRVLEKSLKHEARTTGRMMDEELLGEVQKILGRPVGGETETGEEALAPADATAREAELLEENALLQKRLDKANRELLELELKLEKLAHRSEQDAGIASVYRDVQSLNQEDPHYETKKGFLQVIFEANRALQSQRSGGSAK